MRQTRKWGWLIAVTFVFFLQFSHSTSALEGQWTPEQAQAWYDGRPWLVGCNYLPHTAVNAIEMWSEETYDPNTIDRELGWAQQIGFNSVRVFLHYLVWQQDPAAYKERISNFLNIAAAHNISVMPTLFDDCFKPDSLPGKQPDPIPGVHNSQWVQCPGPKLLAKTFRPELERYVKDIVGHFAKDNRVLLWDIYNEPRLENDLPDEALAWARSVQPEQPLTIGVAGWTLERPQARSAAAHWMEISDVVCFHHYRSMDVLKEKIGFARQFKRPVFCTEYMGTNRSNRFEPVLEFLKNERIAAYNWGFVGGRTQTYLFRSKNPDPTQWWCDIFRQDGTPYNPAETDLIKRLTGLSK